MASEAEYWAARRKSLLEQMEADEARLQEKLARVYKRQVAELERDIAAYYQKYGHDNVIQYRRLMEDLSASDRRLLMERMEDFAAKYPQYAHLLPVRASIYRLNQLEGIQTAMRIQQLEVGAIEQAELDGHFKAMAMNAANLAAEEMGFGSSFYSIDSEVVADTVGEAWSKGESYSEIIWDNREKLAAYLNDDFAKMVARGTPYAECAAALADRFANVSANCIKRLVFTEGTFLFNEAQARVHDKDFEYYAISCADSRACEVCRGLQAEQKANPARYKDRAPGVNFPPMHPWCRCSYTVEVADWDAWIDDYVAKRGGDSVTASMAEKAMRSFGYVSTLAAYAMAPKPPQRLDNIGRRNPVELDKAEYARVMSAINTNFHARYEGLDFGFVRVDGDDGAFEYMFEIDGFGEYTIVARREIP